MAISESVKDLENFPNVTKTVTLDLQKIVPLDNDGDEIYVLSAVTTNAGLFGTINPIYTREFKAGYAKSSGIPTAPFNITASTNQLQVSLDGSPARTIILDQGTGLTAENIAKDIENKIAAIAGDNGLEEGNLAFLCVDVKFTLGRFVIVSGSVSNTYTGIGKSSVQVTNGLSNDASVVLGFNIPTTSEDLSSQAIQETRLDVSYTSGADTINVVTTEGLAVGHAFVVTDGTNKEYFVASGIVTGSIGISGVDGLNNSYAVGSVVQRIFERDATNELASPYTDIDKIVRHSLACAANQINFSV